MTDASVPIQMHEAFLSRAKVVCTLGPASEDEKTLRAMIEAGMNVARINLSHGQHADHAKRIKLLRRLAEEMLPPLAIMADLQGPKIRIGDIENEPMRLDEGREYILTSLPSTTGTNVIPVPQPDLLHGAQVGDAVWLSDGLLELTVVDKGPEELRCQVIVGGPLFSKQGITVPGVPEDIPSITDKDRKDLEFAVAQKVDYMAMSFVRTGDEIQELRHLINAAGANIPIVAKIEHPEALDNLDHIIETSDVLMVARGDLGVKSAFEEVPAHQIRIIHACNRAAIPVITATQMLQSMTHSSHPTRAEANDVFTSVIQGTDAVMLSGETAVGEHPVRSVQTMTRIAHMAEQYFPYKTWDVTLEDEDMYTVTSGIGKAACDLAANLGAKAIITNTVSGRTTRHIAKHRPQSLLISTTPDAETHRQMTLVWGAHSLLVPNFHDTEEMITGVKRAAVESGLVDPGDTVVITGGVPIRSGSGNLNRGISGIAA